MFDCATCNQMRFKFEVLWVRNAYKFCKSLRSVYACVRDFDHDMVSAVANGGLFFHTHSIGR